MARVSCQVPCTRPATYYQLRPRGVCNTGSEIKRSTQDEISHPSIHDELSSSSIFFPRCIRSSILILRYTFPLSIPYPSLIRRNCRKEGGSLTRHACKTPGWKSIQFPTVFLTELFKSQLSEMAVAEWEWMRERYSPYCTLYSTVHC